MLPTLSVLYSELVLSLYPILIKTVPTNLFTQILSRFIVFPTLAILFGSSSDFLSIWTSPYEAFVGLLNGLLNIGHIYVSYLSFKLLPVGSAISLFYLYPLFNVIAGSILFKESLSPLTIILIGIALFGTYLIASSHQKESNGDKEKEKKYGMGVVMGILAAITETMIFIFVRWNKDAQKSPFYTVNHLYPAGLVLLLGYGLTHKNIVDTISTHWIKLLGFNGILGFTGYIARFYAIPKVSTIIFSLLSFFGVAFGYLWGILFTNDKPTSMAIVGGGLIALSITILRYFGIK
jgi:drug/metabolite transporter (DMT)-like permease